MTATGTDPIRELAIDYFTRSRSSTWGPRDKAGLQAWIDAAPAHARAYEEVAGLWAGLDDITHEPDMLSMREKAREGLAHRRLAGVGIAVLAASLLLGLIGLWNLGALSWSSWRDLGRGPAVYSTRIGQISTIALADGSTAILDTGSTIRFSERFRERRVELVKGRALFKVRRDVRRPFVVHAGGKSVTALGTTFDVYLRGKSLAVNLVEGKLRVEDVGGRRMAARPRPSITMTAGYRLVAGETDWDLKPLTGGGALAWLERRLVFDEAPVGEIVAELNRYSESKIIVSDPAIARERMSAVLRGGDPGTFLASVEMLQIASVRVSEGGFLLAPPARNGAR